MPAARDDELPAVEPVEHTVVSIRRTAVRIASAIDGLHDFEPVSSREEPELVALLGLDTRQPVPARTKATQDVSPAVPPLAIETASTGPRQATRSANAGSARTGGAPLSDDGTSALVARMAARAVASEHVVTPTARSATTQAR